MIKLDDVSLSESCYIILGYSNFGCNLFITTITLCISTVVYYHTFYFSFQYIFGWQLANVEKFNQSKFSILSYCQWHVQLCVRLSIAIKHAGFKSPVPCFSQYFLILIFLWRCFFFLVWIDLLFHEACASSTLFCWIMLIEKGFGVILNTITLATSCMCHLVM